MLELARIAGRKADAMCGREEQSRRIARPQKRRQRWLRGRVADDGSIHLQVRRPLGDRSRQRQDKL
jgi:hypothetical protein